MTPSPPRIARNFHRIRQDQQGEQGQQSSSSSTQSSPSPFDLTTSNFPNTTTESSSSSTSSTSSSSSSTSQTGSAFGTSVGKSTSSPQTATSITSTTSGSSSSSSSSSSNSTSGTASSTSSPSSLSTSLTSSSTTSIESSFTGNSSSTSSSTSTSLPPILVSFVSLAQPTELPTSSSSILDLPISTSISSAESQPSNVSQASGAIAEKGFWSNKGAVAGTFTALALVVVGILAFVVFKLRQRKSSMYRESFYDEKLFPEPDFISADSRPTSGHASSESHDLHVQPMDPNQGVAGYHNYHFQNSDPFADVHRPMDANTSLTELTYSYARDVNNQYPSYDYQTPPLVPGSSSSLVDTPNGSHQAAQTQYFNPSTNPFNNNPPPQSINPFSDTQKFNGYMASSGRKPMISPADRDSAAPSVDSFYGGSPSATLGNAL